MRRRIQSAREVVVETVGNWLRHRSPIESAALAFYTLFSLAPVLVILIVLAGAVWGEEAVRGEIVGQFAGLMGRDAARTVQDILRSASRQESGTLASLLGIGTLLLGATAVFAQLQETLNRVWDVSPKPGHLIRTFLKKRLVSFGIVLAIGFLLLVSLGLSAGLAALERYVFSRYTLSVDLLSTANVALSLGVITVLFAFMFRFLPDARIAWRDVWLGAILTSLLFAVGKSLIGLYLGQTGLASAYGAAGSVVVILFWVYYSALILLFGAEFTRVHSRRFRPRGVQPEPGAMRVPEGEGAQGAAAAQAKA